MNTLYLVVTSNLKEPEYYSRFAKSVDISRNIKVYFVNQSIIPMEKVHIYTQTGCKIFDVGEQIPLSKARNIVLKHIYKEDNVIDENAIIMFVDDDAWFPKETLDYLLETEIRGLCLRTIDPDTNKSFNGLNYTEGEVKGWHLVTDICSICLVAPLGALKKNKLYFNEKLGVGNDISQGEESLFIYNLHRYGLRIFYCKEYIYHPYKNSYGEKTYYSLSYFWACAMSHVSRIFTIPCARYVFKYTAGLILSVKDKKYLRRFIMVWRGFFEGLIDKKKVMEVCDDS